MKRSKTITTERGTYLVRGQWTVKQLRELYADFVVKHKSSLTIDQWLVERGKVYFMAKKSPGKEGSK